MTTVEHNGKTYELRVVTFLQLLREAFRFSGLAVCPYCGKRTGLTLGRWSPIGMRGGCNAFCVCGAEFFGNMMNIDGTEKKYWARSGQPIQEKA